MGVGPLAKSVARLRVSYAWRFARTAGGSDAVNEVGITILASCVAPSLSIDHNL